MGSGCFLGRYLVSVGIFSVWRAARSWNDPNTIRLLRAGFRGRKQDEEERGKDFFRRGRKKSEARVTRRGGRRAGDGAEWFGNEGVGEG